MHRIFNLILIILLSLSVLLIAEDKKKEDALYQSSTYSGLKFRSIGPAWTSGRIADFAVNPNDHSEYYVASASGHLWKTVNGGITFTAVADTMPYSLGVAEIDPNNHNVVWVGTGENNHQRAIGYGDGVYKSTDGGKSWMNTGLKESRQIGGIVIDPDNSDIVYVAAEGSIWGPGGDRGLYKTVDGGKTWKKVLEISENTGVNNVIMDPRDSNVLYATSEQRRRHAFTKIGGGPESAVYKSVDGGETWEKIMKGLPHADIGGMGIDISPVNPDVIYLIMEAADNKGGFFRSSNRGASWEKMSDHNSSGQYYNEIYCDPLDADKVYSVETRSKVTKDGGKTWETIGLSEKHVDDHALWIDPDNTNHILIGCDGGVYETYDGTKNWLFKSNLPVTQFYRVNADNDEPFYNVYGGTQDNQSMGGPSQTANADGITNDDWFMTVGGDGFFQAVDPVDPNIVYSEWQYGNIIRYDKKSGETLLIRPEPEKGQKTFRWQWDAPFIISPHSHTRLYMTAERVFRSDDRGETWKQISGDLTSQTDRNSFKVMGKYWSVDAVAKDVSTSQYGIIISLAESEVKENLIYVGTDDGVIQRTEDAEHWTKLDGFPGVPDYTPVQDVLPSQHNENVVYAVFNNHKMDDLKPYVLKSNDKGNSWESISNNLPANGPVSSIVEDPVNPDLLFVGTEWGVYFSSDGGNKWVEFNSGLPKVKVPDMVIQDREKDLVVGTFGRGIYILDDYSPLRKASADLFKKDAYLFPVKNALEFIPKAGKYGQGATYFKAPNPPEGAIFTYYIKDVPKTLKEIRKEKEKELFEKGEPIPQPSYEDLKAEEDEIPPYLIFTISDSDGKVVRKITTAAKKGINRTNWNLRHLSFNPVTMKEDKFNPTKEQRSSLLAPPGDYKVSVTMVVRGEEQKIIDPADFKVDLLENKTLPVEKPAAKVEFEKKSLELAKKVVGAEKQAEELSKKVELLKQTINETPGAGYALMKKAQNISQELEDILFVFNGQPAKASLEEIPPAIVPLSWRLDYLISPSSYAMQNITRNQVVAFDILGEKLPGIVDQLKTIMNEKIPALEKALEEAGAPWVPGNLTN